MLAEVELRLANKFVSVTPAATSATENMVMSHLGVLLVADALDLEEAGLGGLARLAALVAEDGSLDVQPAHHTVAHAHTHSTHAHALTWG